MTKGIKELEEKIVLAHKNLSEVNEFLNYLYMELQKMKSGINIVEEKKP